MATIEEELEARIATLEGELQSLRADVMLISSEGEQKQYPMMHPTAEDVRTKITFCPSNIQSTDKMKLISPSEPNVFWMYSQEAYTLQFVHQVQWAAGCFWEHLVDLTFQNGRIIHIDLSGATDDACRSVVVCAVDCTGAGA